MLFSVTQNPDVRITKYGLNERNKINLVNAFIQVVGVKSGRPAQNSKKRITYVTDRDGHHMNCNIDASIL